MTPASTAPDHGTTTAQDGGERARLELKPKAPTATGYVDGGWWPRSRDLRAELPALLEVLTVRLGRIERVNYPLSDWADPGRRMTVGGTVVHLSGYRSQPAGTLDVISASSRTTLLVVPPDTAPDLARRALTAAGQRGDTTEVSALLPALPHAPVPPA